MADAVKSVHSGSSQPNSGPPNSGQVSSVQPTSGQPNSGQVGLTRSESDSMGKMEVPADRYYGAQTARSLVHFAIGKDTMPPELISAFGVLKKAAALVNLDLGKLSRGKIEAHRAGRRRSDRRKTPPAFSAAHLANRQRHADQHEL